MPTTSFAPRIARATAWKMSTATVRGSRGADWSLGSCMRTPRLPRLVLGLSCGPLFGQIIKQHVDQVVLDCAEQVVDLGGCRTRVAFGEGEHVVLGDAEHGAQRE